jgi:hypothetical protein
MTRTFQARFDGEAFFPEESLPITPNTRVLLTVETTEEPREESRPSPPGLGEPYSFLKYAASLNLEGPEDWSENIDDYLYRGKKLPNV